MGCMHCGHRFTGRSLWVRRGREKWFFLDVPVRRALNGYRAVCQWCVDRFE